MTTSFKLNDGYAIPWIALGTGTALYGKDATNAVAQAIAGGFTHLDGAQAYANEESLGAAIQQAGVPRAQLFVTTKLGKLPAGTSVVESLKESLRKLQLDHVDLFLIHSSAQHQDLPATWKGMEECKAAGLAKSIGVSNFREVDLQTIMKEGSVVPAVNQVEFHPYISKAAEPLLAFCQKNGIVVCSYGGLTPIVRHQGGPLDAVLKAIREKRGGQVTDAQLLFKWANQRGIVVITISSKQERLKEYLDVLNVPDLTEEELESITNGGSGTHHRAFWKHMDEL